MANNLRKLSTGQQTSYHFQRSLTSI